MEKKKLKLLACALAIGLTASFAYSDVSWDGGGSNNLWTTPENWVGDMLPGGTATVVIDNPEVPQALVDDTVTTSVNQIILGKNNGPCTLTVTGGSLTSAGSYMPIGEKTGATGILNISGGDVTAAAGILVGNQIGTTGTVNMSGGTFTIQIGSNPAWWWTHHCVIGDKGVGTLNMSGGTLTVDRDMWFAIGADSSGTLNMVDGTINIAGTIYLDYNEGEGSSGPAPGAIQLDGGVINAGDLVMISTGSLDLAGGAMVLDGDKVSIVEAYVAQGLITGYGVQDAVVVDYNVAIGKTTLAAAGSDINLPPQVDAGDYQSILWTQTHTAQMDATTSDDGKPYLPPPADPCTPVGLTLTWSKISGPGGVTFDPCNAVEDPVATFTAAGFYELRLRGYDGEKDACDVVTIYVRPDNNPIAYWDFETGSGTNVVDRSANNNFGTIAGDPEPNWVSGWIGNSAMEFYGVGNADVSSYVNITTDETIDPNLDNLRYEVTLAAWVKIDDLANAYYPVVVANGNQGWRIFTETGGGFGQIIFTPGDSLSGSRTYSNKLVNDGKWHHVVGVYDYANSKSHLYIDGILDNSEDNAGMLEFGDDKPVTIGARATSATEVERSWNGLIDDVRIYSYALSAAQVADLTAMGDVPPVVDAGEDQTYAIQHGPLQLNATVTEDGIPAMSTLKWTADPCTATFSNDTIEDTIVTFTEAGTYVLRLTADDTSLEVYDEVTIEVENPTCQDIINDGLLATGDISGPDGTPDCYINLYDFAAIAGDWLSCNDPQNTECELPY